MPSKRVLTALVGLPVLVLLVFHGSTLLFFLAVLIVALIGLDEFYHLLGGGGLKVQRFLGLLLGSLLLVGFYAGNGGLVAGVVASSILLVLLFRVFSSREVNQAITEIGITFFGVFYVCYLMGYLILLRGEASGREWIFFLFLTVWAGDTGAYYLGTYLGRHKLYPKISPKKTCEGALGGVACALIAATVGWKVLFPSASLSILLPLGGGLGVIGQLGDLAESLLKRCSGTKDSGSLLPGHGGVLDRFDGILFAAPILYYLITLGVVLGG